VQHHIQQPGGADGIRAGQAYANHSRTVRPRRGPGCRRAPRLGATSCKRGLTTGHATAIVRSVPSDGRFAERRPNVGRGYFVNPSPWSLTFHVARQGPHKPSPCRACGISFATAMIGIMPTKIVDSAQREGPDASGVGALVDHRCPCPAGMLITSDAQGSIEPTIVALQTQVDRAGGSDYGHRHCCCAWGPKARRFKHRSPPQHSVRFWP
jgi:hypothetical protein